MCYASKTPKHLHGSSVYQVFSLEEGPQMEELNISPGSLNPNLSTHLPRAQSNDTDHE